MWYFLCSWSTELIKQASWCPTPNKHELRTNRLLLFLLTTHNPPLFLLHTHSDTQRDRMATGRGGKLPLFPPPTDFLSTWGAAPSLPFTNTHIHSLSLTCTGMGRLTHWLVQMKHVYLITLHQLEFTKATQVTIELNKSAPALALWQSWELNP